MTSEPTPRPWQMYRYDHGSGRIHKDERTLIADVHGPEANREYVFEAVNAYDRLLRIEAAATILLSSVKAVMPEHSPYGCPHTRDWLLGLLDDVALALREGTKA